MKSVILICLLGIVTVCGSFAQEFNYLRSSEGLYEGEVNSIEQDESGLMWLATWSGLISYDGISFQLYRPVIGNSSSLPDKKIKKLFVDSEDNLWIVTSRSLNVYNKYSNSFKNIDFERDNSSFININYISELNGNIIIQSVDGLYYFPINELSNTTFKARPLTVYYANGDVNYISYLTTLNNQLFLVAYYNQPYKSVVYFAKLDTNGANVFIKVEKSIDIPERINEIEYVKSDNNLYFGTTAGLAIYSLNSGQLVGERYFRNKNIRRLLFTSDHKLYCTTTNPELLYLDLHSGKTGKYLSNPNKYGTLLNHNIHCLFEDFSGNLWIGHQGQGVSILNLYKKEFYTYRRNPFDNNSLRSNTVMCINGNNQEVIIGCRTGGFNILPKKPVSPEKPGYSVVNFPGQIGESICVWSIARESDNVFWCATDIGLIKLVKRNGRWIFDNYNQPIYNNTIRKVFVDENKNIWCGTYRGGLLFVPAIENNPEMKYYQYRFDPNDEESLSDDVIMSITLDSKGRFWIGTLNGFNLLKGNYRNLDLTGRESPEMKFERFIASSNKPNRLNNNEINCIFENYDGNIWLATQGGGINIYDPDNDSFSYLTVGDGLPSNDVLGILRDHTGILWLSTNKGLASLSHFGEQPEITTYNALDGIQGDIFMVNSFYKSMDGEMFFGGDNGFTRFYPDRIKPSLIEPKVAFSNLMISNDIINIGDTINNKVLLKQSLNYTDKIVLPYQYNSFCVGVSTMHYQHPGGNKIMYKLEGYNNEWRTAISYQKYIYFTKLPHGEYNLKVKAISSDNIESANMKNLAIVISPPWYLTWYMSIVFIFLIIAIISGIVFLMIYRQRLKYEQQIDKITIENNESKMVFLTNIAHELKTPLSLVIAPIEDIIQNYHTIDPLWKNHIQLISRNSKYLLKLINQIVDFRRLNAGKLKLFLQETDITRLLKDVVLNFKYKESQRNVHLSIIVPSNPIYITVDAQKIEEVLYNLISNAFKHTEDNKSIKVSLEVYEGASGEATPGNNKQLKITVFNEGNEINDEEKEKIFERFYKADESIDGAGIGLSYSKSIVEMHNGSLGVESVKAKGVAFHILLPFEGNIDKNLTMTAIEQDVNMGGFNERELVSKFASGNDKELKIIIVEDNSELRAFLKKILSRIYTCYEAADGDEGWKIIKDIMPDIIITDIIMPHKDGYQLCKQIKENLKTCHIPVILLSAKNAESQIISGYNVGADAYVTKPFDMNLILSQISRLIKNRELIREKYITQNFMVEVNKSNLSKDDEFIVNVRSILEENITDPDFNVKKLSAQLNISTTQLYRKLKVLTGYSPVEFIRVIKLQKAYTLLNTRDNTVKEVCYLSGFNNLSYFIKCFREHFGVTPANYRDKGLAEKIKVDNTNITNLS